VWALTALGGRGLVHHALLGKLLARAVREGDPALLPPECHLRGYR
jgi:glycine/D-amino acid oxidase-like deaminating enzyme